MTEQRKEKKRKRKKQTNRQVDMKNRTQNYLNRR